MLTRRITLDHAGVTPLIEAVKNNRVDIVKVLLERGSFFFVIILNISQHLCVQQVLILRIRQAKVIFLSITRQNVQFLTFYTPQKMKRCRAAFLLTNQITILRVLVILENRFIPLLRLLTTLISLPLMRPCPLGTMVEHIFHLPSLNQVVMPPQTVQGISRPPRLQE